MKPTYENLSSDNLLERYLDVHIQNSNTSLNNYIWIVSQIFALGLRVVEIATSLAVMIFNKGFLSILQVMEVLAIIL